MASKPWPPSTRRHRAREPAAGPRRETATRDRDAVASVPEAAAAAGDPPKPADSAAARRRPGDGTAGGPGASGSAGRGRRLLPSGPALKHAPLLLGLDAAGGEYPQGGEHPDEEDLLGRVWGCRCGSRGTVRDVSGRPFHPRVGDGGRLRRQRLARSDRDSRADLEAHLARSALAPVDSAASSGPVVPLPPVARTPTGACASEEEGESRPRGRRRRLTVPRDVPLAVPAAPAASSRSGPTVDDELEAPAEDGDAEFTGARVEPTHPEVAPTSPEPGAATATRPFLEATADAGNSSSGERGTAGLLADAVARAESARDELAAAESDLDAAVAVAREDRLSWRTIGRATGLGHREAAARWGPPGGEPSL